MLSQCGPPKDEVPYVALKKEMCLTQEVKDPLLKVNITSPLDSPRSACDSGELVQFSAAMFYATEDDAKAVIDVMRIGTLDGSASVSYETQDGSALAGDKYDHATGLLEFEPGETLKSFEVPITEDDNFDTTLEFGINLKDPVNCELGKYLKACRVLILDNDLFPTNSLSTQIQEGTDEALQPVGMSLLLYYVLFCYQRVPSIWWKSILIVLLDQLGNIYYLITISIRVYLVDVVLIQDEKTAQRLLLPSRGSTLLVLGGVWAAMPILIIFLDWLKVGPLDMHSAIQKHLKVNLFRKYLNYSEQSREKVPLSEIGSAMKTEIPDIVQHSYIMIFDLIRALGKIVFMSIFILQKDIRLCLPLVIYPVIMLIFMWCRSGAQLKLAAMASRGESETQSILVRTVISFGLITDYKQRSLITDRYEQLLVDQGRKSLVMSNFNFWNEQLVPTLSVMLIGIYIPLGGHMVLQGGLSIGTFLATIGVYKDLGDRFEGVYVNLRNGLKVVEPLIGITKMLNMGTDLGERMKRNRKRRAFVKDMLAREAKEHGLPSDRHCLRSTQMKIPQEPFYDRLPIALDGIEIRHVASLSSVTAQVPQGKVVLITGPHSSGKHTLVDLLTDNQNPSSGFVLCPSHLRALHVSYQPEMITYLSLYENLVFGAVDKKKDRVRKVFRRVVLGGDHDPKAAGAHESWLVKEFEDGLRAFEEKDARDKARREKQLQRSVSARCSACSREAIADEDLPVVKCNSLDQPEGAQPWYRRMSNNERKRVHLARALVYNPEILVLHRPVDEADGLFGKEILQLLREFVKQRGLDLEESEFAKRRPRTVFFTGGEVKAELCKQEADITWRLGPEGLVYEEDGVLKTASGQVPRYSL